MYEVLTEKRGFHPLNKIKNLGSLTPNETTVFHRASRVGGMQEIEVDYQVTPLEPGDPIEVLDITVTNLPVVAVTLADYHRRVPKIITGIDIDRPTIRFSRPIVIIEPRPDMGKRLVFVKQEIVPFVYSLSDKALEGAEVAEALFKEMRRPQTPEEILLEQTYVNGRIG